MQRLMSIIFFVLSLCLISLTLRAQSSDFILRKAIQSLEANRYEEASNYCDLVLGKRKNSDANLSLAYHIKGRSSFAQEKYDEAISFFSRAIGITKDDVQSFFFRGAALYQKKEYALAKIDFNAVINIDATYSDAKYFLGLICKETKEYERAINEFEEALRVNNGVFTKQAYGYLGWLYDETGDADKSIQYYSLAINNDPKDIPSLYNRGLAYFKKSEYEKAIQDIDEVIRLDNRNGDAYITIIWPLIRMQKFDIALSYYNKYRNLGLQSYIDKGTAWTFYNFFITAVTKNIPDKAYKEALNNIDKALQLYGTEDKYRYVDLLVIKGYTLEQMGLLSEAKDAYNQALAVRANQDDVRKALARITKTETIANNTDNIPPVIELISPSPSRGLDIVPKTETQVIGRAKDASGIATLKINGKTIKAEEDGLFVTSMVLRDGMNDIIITATDNRGNTGSKSFAVTGKLIAKTEEVPIQVVANTTTGLPGYHAIIIAAENYADPTIIDLENPVTDATELKNILTTYYTFQSKNIQTLFNKNRDEIMQAIVKTSNSLSDDDNLLIFYAGHGIAEKDRFGDVDGYWIPTSAKKGVASTYISADDIKKALKRSTARHILVVADACFSGAFTRELSSDASVGVQKQYSVPSRKVMASGNMEPVPDNSRFIFYLKKHLKENKQKYLTAKKLFDGFYEAILNNSDTSPQYAAIKNVGDEGGEFVFIKK